MIEKAFNDFVGKGYTIDNAPNKRECFEAGFMAAVESFGHAIWVVDSDETSLREVSIEPGAINFIPAKKKDVATIIREWEAKFEGEK